MFVITYPCFLEISHFTDFSSLNKLKFYAGWTEHSLHAGYRSLRSRCPSHNPKTFQYLDYYSVFYIFIKIFLFNYLCFNY